MFSGAPMRVARLALIVGLAALALGAFIVFPLSLLSLQAESSLSALEGKYERRGDGLAEATESEGAEPTPSPTASASPENSPSPLPSPTSSASPKKPEENSRANWWKAARMTARALTPALAFVAVVALFVGASAVRKLVQK